MLTIRRAEEKDTDKILDLLSQVLEVHAALRPDLFITGTTKYSHDELVTMFSDESRRIYVAENEDGQVLGYAFAEIREQPKRENMVPFRSLYIDDICVDGTARGQHIGQSLFEHVRSEAAALGCYCLALTVWEGNDSARKFYDRMGFFPRSTTMEYIL